MDRQRKRSERVPSDAVYALIAALVVGVAVAAYVWNPVIAVRILAVVLLLHALGRLILPDGVVPRARSQFADAAVGMSSAVFLWYLASWAATLQAI